MATLLIGEAAFGQTQPAAFTDYSRYDPLGRVVGTITGAGVTPYLASRTSYDADGRVVKIEKGTLGTWEPDNVDPQTWPDFVPYSTTTTTYDFADRKTSETVTGSDGVIRTLKQYNYDVAGRLQCTAVRMDPAQWTSQTDACAPQTNGPNGPDRVTHNIYDVAGQALKVQQAVGTTLQQDYQSYGYTQNGKQSYVIDANGNKSAYSYDGFDRLILWAFPSITAPGAASTTDFEQYGYDANGNRTSLRKRDGRTITYTYDALNRMTVKAFVNGGACVSGYACTTPPSSSVRDVYYSYDLRGLQTYARFDSAVGTDNVYNLYDGLGRLAVSTVNMGGVSRRVPFTYDADGDKISLKHPDGSRFVYTFDGLDRLASAKIFNGAQFLAVTYNSQGSLYQATRGAVLTTYTYDPIMRPSGLTDDLAGTSADVSMTFTLNPANQIVMQGRTNDDYAYAGYTTASTPYTANGLNQYTTVGAGSLGYDSNGNLASTGGTTFTYDVENRLVSATGTLATSMVYDPMGRLYQTSSASGIRQFLYDGGQRIAEYDGSSGAILRRYVHGTGEDDPLIWFEGAGLSDMRSLQSDHRGSVVSVADASGALIAINAYDEYGVPGSGNIGAFQYTGQTWLPDLGMYYYKARIYSAKLGRFLQTDPIGYKDQMDLYTYVSNDPIDNRDPTGEDCENNHGTTYCVTKDYNVSFPTPRGFQEVRPWIANYHQYDTPVVSPQNAQSTRTWVRNNPTPGTPSPATPQGTPNNATPKGIPANSPVMSYYVLNRVTGNMVVVNATLPGHPLGNGIVIRDTVPNADGTSTIHNYGEGNGLLQSKDSPIAGEINSVWAAPGMAPPSNQPADPPKYDLCISHPGAC